MCCYGQHGCRFYAAPPDRLFRLYLLSFLLTILAIGVSAQPISFCLETAVGTPLLGTDAGDYGAPTFVDLDGDGDQDLVAGNLLGTIKAYRRDLPITNPIFVELIGPGVNPFHGIDVGDNSTPAFVDIDDDGDMDCFIGEKNGNFNFYRNDGGPFTLVTGGANPLNGFTIAGGSSPSFGDLDGDGDMDFVSGRISGGVRVFLNDGSASSPDFVSLGTLGLSGTGTGNNSMPTLVDLNKDGRLDVVTGNINGIARYYQQNALGVFVNTSLSTTCGTGLTNLTNGGLSSNNNSAPGFTDMDGDEDMDFAIGVFDGRMRFIRNTSCNTKPATPTCPAQLTVSLDDEGRFDVTLGYLTSNGASAPATACGTFSYELVRQDSDLPPVVNGPLSIDCMDMPATTIIYTVRDNFNLRTSSCAMSVVVLDQIPPVARCVASNIVVPLDGNGEATLDLNNLEPSDFNDGSLDNCDESLLSFSLSSSFFLDFDCDDVGGGSDAVVNMHVDDASGNSSLCTLQVVVVDEVPPVPDEVALLPLVFEPCQLGDLNLMDFAPRATE